jgi:uncharacterized membrane protein YfhO
VSQRFYPGWKASVDENATRILSVNGGLQAVMIPSGKHTVKLEFAPAFRFWLIFLAIVALVGVLVLLFYGMRPRHHAPDR